MSWLEFLRVQLDEYRRKSELHWLKANPYEFEPWYPAIGEWDW
jgi:hypothetical protein